MSHLQLQSDYYWARMQAQDTHFVRSPVHPLGNFLDKIRTEVLPCFLSFLLLLLLFFLFFILLFRCQGLSFRGHFILFLPFFLVECVRAKKWEVVLPSNLIDVYMFNTYVSISIIYLSMYTCLYTYIYTYIHIYIQTYKHTLSHKPTS